MGKNASRKGTIYKKLHNRTPELKTVTMYIIRPIRNGEQNKMEYFFMDCSYLEQCRKNGILIEHRTYNTVYDPQSYSTTNDRQIDLKTGSYLTTGTLESYGKMRVYCREETLVLIYIHVEDGLRLRWAPGREQQQTVLKCKKMCRRLPADEEDFSPGRLEENSIARQYENVVLEDCFKGIVQEIEGICCEEQDVGQPEFQNT